jgi:uncharacterized protein (TIGR00369 family)
MEIKFDILKNIFEESIPFNKFLGLKLLEVSTGFAKILVPFRPELIGEIRERRMHGGVITSAMDTVAGAACFSTIDVRKDKLATIDLTTDFLSPISEGDVVVTGKVKKSGNRVIFIYMEAYHPDEPEQILAQGRAAFSVKRAN